MKYKWISKYVNRKEKEGHTDIHPMMFNFVSFLP